MFANNFNHVAYPNGQLFGDMINSASIFKPREKNCRASRKVANNDYQFRLVCLSAWNNLAPTGRILMKFNI